MIYGIPLLIVLILNMLQIFMIILKLSGMLTLRWELVVSPTWLPIAWLVIVMLYEIFKEFNRGEKL